MINGQRRTNYTAAIASINSNPKFPVLIANFLRSLVSSTSDGRIVVFFRENCVINAVKKLLTDVEYFVCNQDVKLKRELGDERLILAIDKKVKEGVDIQNVKHVVQTYSSPHIEQAEGRAREDDFYFWYFVNDNYMHEKHYKEAMKWCDERSKGDYVEKQLSLSEEYEETVNRVEKCL